MRLIDKLRARGISIPAVPVVVVDNVANYMAGFRDDGKLRYVTDLPCVKPPFERMWIEFRATEDAAAGGGPPLLGRLVGFYVQQAPPGTDERGDVWVFQAFGEAEGGRVAKASRSMFSMLLSPEGVCTEVRGPDGDQTTIGALWARYCVCLAISFMHCRNVVTEEIVNPIRRGYTKKTSERTARYSVIKIDPMRDVLRREGGAETNGLAKALHICRGHFKLYDKPLFGKTFTGTVWVPAHVRGTADKGVIDKSYDVTTPPKPKGNA